MVVCENCKQEIIKYKSGWYHFPSSLYYCQNNGIVSYHAEPNKLGLRKLKLQRILNEDVKTLPSLPTSK